MYETVILIRFYFLNYYGVHLTRIVQQFSKVSRDPDSRDTVISAEFSNPVIGFVYSADADGGRGRGRCVFGGLCVDM